MTDFLSLEDLLEVAAGVLSEVHIRDLGLLESASARPRTTVFGELAYPDFFTQGAALLHSLVRNHCLVDGNKRLAWAAMRVFLIMNGYRVVFDIDDAEQMVLAAARGELDVHAISSWIAEHAVEV